MVRTMAPDWQRDLIRSCEVPVVMKLDVDKSGVVQIWIINTSVEYQHFA